MQNVPKVILCIDLALKRDEGDECINVNGAIWK